MNLHLAQHLARDLMRQHGLADWTFKFDHARRRFGSCRTRAKLITLSRHLTFLNTEAEVRDTILHEIAHALCPGDNHGPAWRAMCRQIGAKPTRCYTDNEVTSPPRRPARFEIGCPKCNWWTERRRLTRRKLICAKCRGEVMFKDRPSGAYFHIQRNGKIVLHEPTA
jgi:predicted SprT family Zn-dependent metalloprotease